MGDLAGLQPHGATRLDDALSPTTLVMRGINSAPAFNAVCGEYNNEPIYGAIPVRRISAMRCATKGTTTRGRWRPIYGSE